MAPAHQQRWFLGLAVPTFAIFAITAIAYLPTTRCGFIWDDDDYVIHNDTLRDIEGLKRIWLDPSATPQYYPLVHTSFWCEYQTWELNATGYHVTNVAFHILNAILLWQLLVRLSVPGAWAIALLFAVHPVHVESVAWITERKNVLSGLFYLGSVHAFLSHWDFTNSTSDAPVTSGTRRWLWLVASYVFFIAALLSKTVTATLPAAILVLVWWKHGYISTHRSRVLIPMFALGIAFGLFTVWLEKFQVGASGMEWDLSFVERCLIAGRALWFYAGKLVWPVPLIFTYPRWEIDASQVWQFLFPVAALGVIIWLWRRKTKLGRGPLAAVLLFAGTLFPALGFFDVYPMRFSFVADHFQYLASVPMITLVVASATTWLANRPNELHRIGRILLFSIVALMTMLTWQQALIYEGLETLWRDTLAKNPASFLAHNNLGALLNRRGDYDEAEDHLREAIRLKPDFADSHVNLGKAREGLGDIDDALENYCQAAEINPRHVHALNGLGAMHGAKGNMQLAEKYFREAIDIEPSYRSAIDNLIKTYIATDKLDEAESMLEGLLDQEPSNTDILGTLGVLNFRQKDFSVATQHFHLILEITPNEPNAFYYLSLCYRELGDNEKATHFEQEFERASGAG